MFSHRGLCSLIGVYVQEMQFYCCHMQISYMDNMRYNMRMCNTIQVCGGYPDALARTAQLLEENISADFVDVNMGGYGHKCGHARGHQHPFHLPGASQRFLLPTLWPTITSLAPIFPPQGVPLTWYATRVLGAPSC